MRSSTLGRIVAEDGDVPEEQPSNPEPYVPDDAPSSARMPNQEEQEEEDDETFIPEDLRDFTLQLLADLSILVYMQSFRCPTTWTVCMLWTKQGENMKRNWPTGHMCI
jgi:hypothetical protein